MTKIPIKIMNNSKRIPEIIRKNLKEAPMILMMALERKASKYLLKSKPLPYDQ